MEKSVRHDGNPSTNHLTKHKALHFHSPVLTDKLMSKTEVTCHTWDCTYHHVAGHLQNLNSHQGTHNSQFLVRSPGVCTFMPKVTLTSCIYLCAVDPCHFFQEPWLHHCSLQATKWMWWVHIIFQRETLLRGHKSAMLEMFISVVQEWKLKNLTWQCTSA